MAFPSITPSNVTLSVVNPTRVTTTINNIEQRTAIGSPYFRLVAEYENLEKSEVRQFVAHTAEVAGPQTSFTFTLPSYLGNNSAGYSGTITSGSASIGATSVSVTTSGNGAILKAGDLIKFANHNKVYTVKGDVTASGLSATINIFPSLRTAVSSTSVTHTSLSMTVRYVTDNQELGIGVDEFSTLQLEMVEVLG